MPTPPAAPWTSSRSPGRSPAWVKSASWAVVKTSGTPPAASQLQLLGHRHRRALVHDRELGLAPTRDDRHDAVARLEALHARAALDHLAGQLQPGDVLGRAGRRRVAALELHHVGAVEPGAADADEQVGVPGDRDRDAPRRRSIRRESWRRASASMLPPGRRSRPIVQHEFTTSGVRADSVRVRTTPGQYVPSPWNSAEFPRCGGSRASASRPPRSAQPGLRRPWRPARRAPPGAADPGLHGRRPVARHARGLAAAQRLLHPPHGHPRQPRLLRGGLPAPRGAARAHGRASRRARDRDRPEPRRRVREGAGGEAARARPGHRHARLAERLPAGDPPARARPGRPGQRARHRPACPGCSRSAACAGSAARRSAPRSTARSPTTSATSRSTPAATASCSGSRAWTRRPTSSSRSPPRTAGWASTPRPSSPSPSALHGFRGDDPLLADDLPRAA